MDDFQRSISFEITGAKQSPSVAVNVVEVDGSLVFTLDVMSPKNLVSDLRGLFFDFNGSSKLADLTYEGPDVTVFDTGGVINLGTGVTMKGAASPFDVGLAFGTAGIGIDGIHSTTFTLSHPSEQLTLDDIANVQFGARLTSTGDKLLVMAPAAPDAINDVYTIYEDGQPDLSTPSTVPAGQLFELLANDTDADGDILTITAVQGALHGTVQIVDGADADIIAGDAVLYTPFEDYSGPDSFMYAISDNHGGTDFAAVDVGITAVADIPDLTYEVRAGAETNQLIVSVTAVQTDADGSEFIDGISFSGIPATVTVEPVAYNPVDQPDQITKEFLITLPYGEDTSFDLGITAVSQEESNGDTESATVVVPIAMEYTANDLDRTFMAQSQSIWATGAEYTFTDDRFLGIDESWDASGGGFVYGASDGHLKAGFQSTLNFEAGSIDASVPYDILVETDYNRTTDVLKISSNAQIAEGTSFTTEGPEGSYQLDFLFDFFLHAEAGLSLAGLNWDIISLDIGPYDVDQNILDVESSDLSVEIPLYAGFSLAFAWPELDTSSTYYAPNIFTSSGTSNNFLELGLDVDELAITLLGLSINPFDIGFDIGVAWGNIELADLDLSAGLNFIQDFKMTVNSLPGLISYENGSVGTFNFGEDIILANASSYDADHDGAIEFSLALDPNVNLQNGTDLGLELGYIFDILKLSGGYTYLVDSGSFEVGPVYSASDSVEIPLIGVYDQTFALDFGSQTVTFAA